jgi:outer membrane protein assembly factor BamB
MMVNARDLPKMLTESNLLWEVETGARWHLPMPAIAGDAVLVGGDATSSLDVRLAERIQKGGSLTCLDLYTGAVRWQLLVPVGGYTHSYGVCTMPVVRDDRIYLLATTELFCLDLDGLADGNDGMQTELELLRATIEGKPVEGMESVCDLPEDYADVIWHNSLRPFALSYQDATSCMPLLLGDQLWISTSHDVGMRARAAGGDKPRLLVVDTETGAWIARDRLDVPIVFHGEWSSPSLVETGEGSVVVFADGYGVLHGFSAPAPSRGEGLADIKELWAVDLNPPEWRRAEDGREYVYTDDRRLFFKYPEGYPDDATRWMPPEESPWGDCRTGGPSEVIATPCVVGNRIYVGLGRDNYYNRIGRHETHGYGRFLCLELERPDKPPGIVWETREVDRTQCTASVAEGLVYIADAGAVLHCLDALTGEAYWRRDLGRRLTERSQMLADDKIYAATDNGEVFVFRAGRVPVLVSESKLRSGPATPAPVDGLIVVAMQKKVQAFAGPNHPARRRREHEH